MTATDTYTNGYTSDGEAKKGFLSDNQLDRLEGALDRNFSIAGFRFGFDGVIGLIPGIGDAATGALSAFIIAEAWKRGAQKRTLLSMAKNSVVDTLIGTIPLVGDLFDFAYRSNTKNIQLLKADLARKNRAVSKV